MHLSYSLKANLKVALQWMPQGQSVCSFISYRNSMAFVVLPFSSNPRTTESSKTELGEQLYFSIDKSNSSTSFYSPSLITHFSIMVYVTIVLGPIL